MTVSSMWASHFSADPCNACRAREMSSSGAKDLGEDLIKSGSDSRWTWTGPMPMAPSFRGPRTMPPRWAAQAAAFRGLLGAGRRLGLAYGPGDAAAGSICSCPKATPRGARGLCAWRLLDGLRARELVASGGGGAGAGLGRGDAVLHAGARRRGSPR